MQETLLAARAPPWSNPAGGAYSAPSDLL